MSPRCGRRRDAAARGDGSARQIAISGSQQHRVRIDAQCGSKMDGVVAPQTMDLGKISRGACEGRIETDDIQLSAELIDPVDRTAQGSS